MDEVVLPKNSLATKSQSFQNANGSIVPGIGIRPYSMQLHLTKRETKQHRQSFRHVTMKPKPFGKRESQLSPTVLEIQGCQRARANNLARGIHLNAPLEECFLCQVLANIFQQCSRRSQIGQHRMSPIANNLVVSKNLEERRNIIFGQGA